MSERRPPHQPGARLKGAFMARTIFTSPLDDAYLWAAVRYVERSPVRAGMVKHAENYRWPSAHHTAARGQTA